jgi:5-methylcytosine-specific restriction endonuclease McrA
MGAMKRCQECGGLYDAEEFFRRHHGTYAHVPCGTRAICLACEQTARDDRKQTNRWPDKVRGTIRRHARKLGIAAQTLEVKFGWNIQRLVRDAQRAYEHTCAYCDEKFAGMGHGLGDITLDIVNPKEPPFYLTNVRWICMTCNRQKSRTPPATWAAKRAWWEVWKNRPKPNRPVQTKLFTDDDDEE